MKSNKHLNSLLKKILIISAKIVFIILAFYLIFSKIEFEKFYGYIKSSDPLFLFLSYLMLQASLFFSAMRSRFYFSTFGLNLKRTFSWMLYYVGTFFNVLLPGGISGDGYKVYILWKLEKFPKIKSLRIMLYERVNGFHALVGLGLLFGFHTTIIYEVPYGLYLNIAALILLTPCYLWGVKYVLKDSISTALEASIYSIVVQLLQVFSALFLVRAILPSAESIVYYDLTFLFIAGSIAAIIPISIGGAGLRELTLLYGLSFISYELVKEAGIAFAFMSFALYFLTSIIGLPILLKLNSVKRLTKRKIKLW